MSAPTAGLGLKAEHFEDALGCRAPGLWLEVHAEMLAQMLHPEVAGTRGEGTSWMRIG